MKIALSDFRFTTEFPVHWGDMDAARHVNNLIYLRWAESGRIRYFEKMKLDTTFSPADIGPILGWQDCKYMFPMTYPDTAVVGVRVTEIEEDRFIMESGIFSKRHHRIAALSKQIIVPYDYGTLRKAPLPAAWIAAVKELEG
ncbi:MAG: thioesterase family protein [Bacteroidota bacterium]